MARVVASVVLWLAACSFDTSTSAGPRDPNAPDAAISEQVDAADPGDGPLAALDMDMDGVPDGTDNCDAIHNTGQYDEDGDGFGDVCDNCPQVSNAGQENVEETQNGQSADMIGDICDPRPQQSGDTQVLFLGFNDPAELANFSKAGDQDFAVLDGMLQARVNTSLGLLWQNDLGAGDGTVEAKVTYRNVSTSGYRFRGITLMGMFARDGNFGRGLGCGEMVDTSVSASAFLARVRFTGTGFLYLNYGGGVVAEGNTVTYRATTRSGIGVACEADAETWSYDGLDEHAGTGVAIATYGTGADVEYLVVYSR